MTRLRLNFLGPAHVTQAGEPVDLSAAKSIALLAYLSVTGKSQTRDHLVALLWPESLPDAARKNLRNTLWRIRKALGDDVIAGDADRIALADDVWVDVRIFEAVADTLSGAEVPAPDELRTAADLYRGPLLDGLTLTEAPDFEIWLTTQQERLRQLHARILDALVATWRAEAKWADVIAVAQQALAEDNLQEPMHRALMEAHARLGERTEALRQYDVLHDTLSRELGVEPLPETQALRSAILDGDLPPVETPAPTTRPAPPRRAPAPDQRATLPFVGRQAERAALDAELQTAAGGQMRIVLLTGELGIGKSRLWQAWSATLPPDVTVLETRCLDTTRSLPFAPLTNLFSRRPCVEHLFHSPSPLSPVWLAELARLLPEIRQHWPELPAPIEVPPEEERRRLFEAFVQVLQALESQPLLLFIDDLHWADHATLDWLVYLTDRLSDAPLLLVCAYRPQDATPELGHVVADWQRQDVLRRLPLSQLTLAESIELLEALGGGAAQAEKLHARSAGNPYFLIELSRAPSDDTPPGLAEHIRTRLQRLSGTARQVLQAAAILEPDVDPSTGAGLRFATLRRTSGRGEEETLDAIDALLDAAILVERDGHFEFAHPLVATVVREDLSIARRSFLHRRAAEALEATHAGQLPQVTGQLASHYAGAGRTARAAHYAELAATRALELSAPAEAVAFYRQTLTWEPTPARRLGLGWALYLHGDLDEARETFHAAQAEFEAQDDEAGVAEAYLALAESYLPAGRGDKTVEWAERALPHVDFEQDPLSHARAHFLLGAGQVQSGQSLAEAEDHLVEAAELAAERDLAEMAARSRFELGNLLAQRGDLSSALAAFEETIALAERAGDCFQTVLGHNNLAYHALLAGDLETAHEHIEAGLALAEEHSLFLPRQYLFSTRGEIALAEEQLDAAAEWFEQALAEAQSYDNRTQVANVRANLAQVARARGDLDEALATLETAREAVADFTAPHLQTQIDLWLAEMHHQRGERPAAEEALSRAESRLAGGERAGLQEWARRVRSEVERSA